MTQQTSPFIECKYGWAFGESGWNTGMDENLVKFSYLFDGNIDGIVSSLPSAVSGKSYFLTSDNRVYYAVGSTWFSSPTPKWFMLKLRTTGDTYQFDGSLLNAVPSLSGLGSDVDALQAQISSFGTAALKNVEFFASQSALDIVSANANNYTDSKVAAIDVSGPVNTLRNDIATASGTTKGAYQVGFSGRTVAARLMETINIKDVMAANPSFTVNQAFIAAQNLLPSDPTNVGRRGGIVFFPPGDYLITGVAKMAGVIVQGCGPSTRIYNNNTGSYSFTSSNVGGIQDLGGFRDILFDGGDPSTPSGASRIGFGAINISSMHAGFATNCLFQRFSGRAVSNQNTLSVKFELNGCYFTGNVIAVLLSDGNSTALHLNECYIAFNDYGVLLTGQSDFRLHQTIVEQNYIIGMRVDGSIDQGTIVGCYFEQNGGGTGGSKTNIRIENGQSVAIRDTLFNMLGSAVGSTGSGWSHVFCGDLNNLELTGNTFNSGAGITGFDLSGASGATKPINVGNNNFYAASTFGRYDSLANPRIAHSANKVAVPTTATSIGRVGQFAADASFYYVYTGDNTSHSWRRVAIAAW